MEEEGIRPIELRLKEVTVSDKDTKEGQTKTHKAVFKGNIGDIETGFTLKTDNKRVLEDLVKLSLGTELFIKIIPNPQTTLNDVNIPLRKKQEKTDVDKKDNKKKKKSTDIIEQEPGIIDAEHRLVSLKELPAGGDENILDELKG